MMPETAELHEAELPAASQLGEVATRESVDRDLSTQSTQELNDLVWDLSREVDGVIRTKDFGSTPELVANAFKKLYDQVIVMDELQIRPDFADFRLPQVKPSVAIGQVLNPVIREGATKTVIREVFASEEPENGPLHCLIQRSLAEGGTLISALPHVKAMMYAYDAEDFPGLLHNLQADEFGRKIFHQLLLSKQLNTVLHEGYDKAKVDDPSLERKTFNQDFYKNILQILMPEATERFLDNVSFTMTAKGSVTSDELLANTLTHVEKFGADYLQELYDICGTTLFGKHSAEQLSLMHNVFVTKDSAELERLQKSNVWLVITNTDGDEIGVFHKVPELYTTNDNSTLFFEAGDFEDHSRIRKQLEVLEIHPSLVVYAQHSSAGQFNLFSRRRQAGPARGHGMFIYSPDYIKIMRDRLQEQNATGYSLDVDGSEFIMMAQNMKPNTETGEKEIIFHACELGKITEAKTVDGEPPREPTSFLREYASLMLTHGGVGQMTIYALGESMDMKRVDGGLVASKPYSGVPTFDVGDEANKRTPFDATEILISQGISSERNVPEIPLAS